MAREMTQLVKMLTSEAQRSEFNIQNTYFFLKKKNRCDGVHLEYVCQGGRTKQIPEAHCQPAETT